MHEGRQTLSGMGKLPPPPNSTTRLRTLHLPGTERKKVSAACFLGLVVIRLLRFKMYPMRAQAIPTAAHLSGAQRSRQTCFFFCLVLPLKGSQYTVQAAIIPKGDFKSMSTRISPRLRHKRRPSRMRMRVNTESNPKHNPGRRVAAREGLDGLLLKRRENSAWLTAGRRRGAPCSPPTRLAWPRCWSQPRARTNLTHRQRSRASR